MYVKETMSSKYSLVQSPRHLHKLNYSYNYPTSLENIAVNLCHGWWHRIEVYREFHIKKFRIQKK
jgi:hypothetical protein